MPKEKSGNEPDLPDDLRNVTTALEWISPELAGSLLKLSPPWNRGIGKRVVRRYANDMVEDRWLFTGESIVLAVDGRDAQGKPNWRILDGWHRLNAIAESGRGQWLIVVRYVPVSAFHYIDHGRGRGFKETLQVLQRPKAYLEAAATAYLTGYSQGRGFVTTALEEHQKWETWEKHKDDFESLCERYGRRTTLKGIPPGLLIAVHFTLSGLDQDQADGFMDLVLTGDELEADHPVAQFRAQVRRFEQMNGQKPSNMPLRYGAGLLKAWNLVRNNEKVAKFILPTKTPTPF